MSLRLALHGVLADHLEVIGAGRKIIAGTIIGFVLVAPIFFFGRLAEAQPMQPSSASWREATNPYPLDSNTDPHYETIACASSDWCLVAGGDNNQPGSVLTITPDGGRTWVRPPNLPPSIASEIDSLACSGMTCWAVDSADRSLAKSANGGQSWMTVSLPSVWQQNGDSPDDVACAPRMCLLGTTDDVEETENGGTSWTAFPLPPGDSLSSLACSIMGACDAVFGIGPEASHGQVLATLTPAGWTTSGALPRPSSDLSCASSLHCVALSDDLETTSDGGHTWSDSPLPKVRQPNFSSLACTSANRCAVVGFDGNSWATWFQGGLPHVATRAKQTLLRALQEPATWQELPTPPDTSAVVCTSAQTCLSVADKTVFQSTSNGQSWTPLSSLDEQVNQLTCGSSGCMALGSQSAWIEVSRDGGDHWSMVQPPGWNSMGIDAQAASCTKTTCFVAGDSQNSSPNPTAVLATTTNGGETWGSLVAPSGASQAVALGCVSPRRCLFEYGANQVITQAAAWTSDGGHSWTPLPAPPDSWGQVTSAGCKGNGSCFVVGNFVLKSTDSGRTWMAIQPPTPSSVHPPYQVFGNMSCSATLCVLAGAGSNNRFDYWRSSSASVPIKLNYLSPRPEAAG